MKAQMQMKPLRGRDRIAEILTYRARRRDKFQCYKALIEALRVNEIAGVTVYRGILGYGERRHIHKNKPCTCPTTAPSCSRLWKPKRS